jgi:hypothetical protein
MITDGKAKVKIEVVDAIKKVAELTGARQASVVLPS